jgi:hypothetical protein
MKLFFINIIFINLLFFVINSDSTKAYADRFRMVLWTMDATFNGESINLFYYGSNFSFLDFNWQEANKINNQRSFIPNQKWTNEYKKFFLSKDSVIIFSEIDPNDKARKYYESRYYPDVLIAENEFAKLKNEDEIIVKKIYSNIEGETFFLAKDDFARVKKSYKNRFQINAKIYLDNLEKTRVFLFLNIKNNYLPGEILNIIRSEGEKILTQDIDRNTNKQFPPPEFKIEYNFIRNNFDYFKKILLEKYGTILIEFNN